MTTTTERPAPSSPADYGVRNARLYLVALLASGYVLAWWLLGAPAPGRAGAVRDVAPSPSPSPAASTWYRDLPVGERPIVELPAGWHVADPTTSTPAPATTARAAPAPVRVSPARAGRIRTRSS